MNKINIYNDNEKLKENKNNFPFFLPQIIY